MVEGGEAFNLFILLQPISAEYSTSLTGCLRGYLRFMKLNVVAVPVVRIRSPRVPMLCKWWGFKYPKMRNPVDQGVGGCTSGGVMIRVSLSTEHSSSLVTVTSRTPES